MRGDQQHVACRAPDGHAAGSEEQPQPLPLSVDGQALPYTCLHSTTYCVTSSKLIGMQALS